VGDKTNWQAPRKANDLVAFDFRGVIMSSRLKDGALARDPPTASADNDRRWYVAQTLPHREAGARQQLLAQGFEAYLPQVWKTVRHARKMRTVRAPIFPGYLFIQMDVARARWRAVNGTFGVTRLLTAHDRPAPAPVGVVESLLAMEDCDGVVRRDAALLPGQRVTLTAGPFARTVGELLRLDGPARACVLLEIMGGQVPITVDRASLRAA
jgi:transcriptional antiterminator RfaH